MTAVFSPCLSKTLSATFISSSKTENPIVLQVGRCTYKAPLRGNHYFPIRRAKATIQISARKRVYRVNIGTQSVLNYISIVPWEVPIDINLNENLCLD